MFEKKFVIQSIDSDEFGVLKLSALFKYIQLVAGEAIEDAGIGQKVLMEKGLLWFLTRLAIKIKKWPSWQEEVTMKTYPNENKKFIYPRQFIIYDKDGEEIIRIVSTWALIDSIKRKITIYDLSEFENFIVEKHDNEMGLPNKLMNVGEIDYCYTHTVRYTDCDINHHLNNTRYIDLILDVNKSCFYKDKEIEYFQIQYELEGKEEDKIDLYKNENYVVGKINEKTSFTAYIKYKERKNG